MIDLSGMKIGKVLQNIDEKKRERIKISVYGIHAEDVGVWAENANSIPGFSSWIPKVGDSVFCMFIKDFKEEYDRNRLIYFGVVKHNVE